MAERKHTALQKIGDIDILGIVKSTATSTVKNHPMKVSMWVLGLLLAALATGFSVSDVQKEAYGIALNHAEEVDREELGKAWRNLQKAEEHHYELKGWFWSCDASCQAAADKVDMARAEAARVMAKRDALLNEARREVGIWSTFGVSDVRSRFWSAWKSGKDWAARWTMFDAFLMMMPGRREETSSQMVLKLVMQYVINLTFGLVGAFFFFVYNVYSLICSYGEPTLSGIAFFLLALVAGVATVGTYILAMFGTVVGGGVCLVRSAAKQAKMEDRVGGGRGLRERCQAPPGGHEGGRVGGMHND